MINFMLFYKLQSYFVNILFYCENDDLTMIKILYRTEALKNNVSILREFCKM